MDVICCRQTHEPLYHQIDQTMNGMRRVYRRLLAPFEDQAGRVRKVYYAVRWLAEPAVVLVSSRETCVMLNAFADSLIEFKN